MNSPARPEMEEPSLDRRLRSTSGKAKTTRMKPKEKRKKRARLLLRDGNMCWWCYATFTLNLEPTFDHLVGLRAGGNDSLKNLVLACAPCNNGRANPPLGRRRRASDNDQPQVSKYSLMSDLNVAIAASRTACSSGDNGTVGSVAAISASV